MLANIQNISKAGREGTWYKEYYAKYDNNILSYSTGKGENTIWINYYYNNIEVLDIVDRDGLFEINESLGYDAYGLQIHSNSGGDGSISININKVLNYSISTSDRDKLSAMLGYL